MNTKLFAMAIATVSLFSQGAHAAQLFNGVDTQGNRCQIVFNALKFGSVVMNNACDFETDGPGPWCEGKKAIPTRQAMGYGSFTTVAGSTPFTINDRYVMVETATPTVVAQGQNGGSIEIKLVGPRQVSVHTLFLTPYGKTLSRDQIVALFAHRPAGVSYQELSQRIYVDVTCNAQN